jgi:RES domain-containing protein
VRLTGLVYRAHNPRWAFAPASGQGAAVHGGRFNPVGRQALYTSRRLETAWLEAQQGFPFKTQPMTICAYDVDCEDMLDLTDPAILDARGIAPDHLACPWEADSTAGRRPASWVVADRLIAEGTAGVVVPSFAHGATVEDVNAVFWRWSDMPPHQVRVIDPLGRLPRDDRAWR